MYTVGTDPADRARLQRQSDDLAAHTLELLSHIEMPLGDGAIDVGCGPAGSIALLTHQVSPTGSVTSIDTLNLRNAAQMAGRLGGT
jgi:trans-aconitate methyltransferase